MKLPIYIISDNHFLLEDSKKERYRREKLFDLFKKIQTTGGTLIIGGDFFTSNDGNQKYFLFGDFLTSNIYIFYLI